MSSARAPAAGEKNTWVRPVSIFVLGLLIAWNCIGWLLDKGATGEGFFLVVFTAGFMALGINASAQMRRCWASVETPSLVAARRFWTAVLICTSLWSAGSAHHAYGQIVAGDIVWAWTFDAVFALLNAAPLLVVLTAAAFFEPLLMWAIETTEHAVRKSTPITVPALIDKGETAPAPIKREPIARRPAPALSASRTPAAIVERSVPSLPLTDAELELAIKSVVDTQGANVVSLSSVARAAENILGRTVPRKRVEEHPKRRELFERYKTAS